MRIFSIRQEKGSLGRLEMDGFTAPCSLGRSGVIPAADKREGDGATPLGDYPFRWLYYRADRMLRPHCALPVFALSPNDGWCDAPGDPATGGRDADPRNARMRSMT